MKRFIFFCSFCFLFPGAGIASLEPEVVLGTNIFSASSPSGDDVIQGGSVEHIRCIFADMQQPYRIQTMPWLRARQEVRKGTIDGFFTAVSIDAAEHYASFSNPLVLENWYWFWRSDMSIPDSLKDKATLGVILGSQQATWLADAGYTKPQTANDLPQMLKMLFAKRIDVVLADKETFEKAAQEMGIDSDAYQYRFFRYVPLGVYFGSKFITAHPGFLQRFNQHIAACLPGGFQLSKYERDKIKKLITPLFLQWEALPELVAATMAQNENHKNLSQSEIMTNDKLWQEEFQQNTPAFSAAVLADPLSQKLRELKASAEGFISEIILMDARGINVAVSDMTSDYWQGDEAKYLLSADKAADHWLFEAVVYDESTKRFQVHVSKPVFSQKNQMFIGVLTLGVDVEKALSLGQ